MRKTTATLGVVGLGLMSVTVAANAAPPEDKKITICHATSAAGHPFVVETISLSALKAHANDTRDIVPTNSGDFFPRGQNLSATNLAFLANKCVAVVPPGLPPADPGTGHETPGSVEETPGAAEETPAMGGETPDSAEETPGPVVETPVAGDETPAAGGETPGAAVETPGPVVETPGAAVETPGAAEETPGPVVETPGAADETPGAAEETPGAAEETPVAGEKTPVAGEETAGSDATPVLAVTPLARDVVAPKAIRAPKIPAPAPAATKTNVGFNVQTAVRGTPDTGIPVWLAALTAAFAAGAAMVLWQGGRRASNIKG